MGIGHRHLPLGLQRLIFQPKTKSCVVLTLILNPKKGNVSHNLDMILLKHYKSLSASIVFSKALLLVNKFALF